MVLAALALPASARADKPFFDVRASAPEAAPMAATQALAKGPEAVVDVDPITKTPRVLARLDGALSAPAPGAAATIGLGYVKQHLDALGLSEADLDTLGAPAVTSAGGVRQVRWRQSVDGIEAADSELRVDVSDDGRVLSVSGAPAPDLPADTTPTLDAGQAVRQAQDDVDAHRSLIRRSASQHATTYTDGTTAKLTLYARKLAWRVLYRAAPDAVYDVVVDAQTGAVLRRANLVDGIDGRVWDNYPTAAFGGAALLTPLPNLTSATTLDGPYVHAYSDLNDDDVANGTTEEVVPGDYPFQTLWGCSPPCSWSGSGTTWTTNRQQNAVQAFYLANRFRDHLATDLGFDDFKGTDKLELQTDDSITSSVPSYSNANMFTPPKGKPPVMQMYLFRSPQRNMNGGDDASILWHEYTHGLTSRLVADADGVAALSAPQAGAMGEGFSDFFAKSYLVTQFPAIDTANNGDVRMGDYTDNQPNQIRKEALDCAVGVIAQPYCPRGGFTYGDFAHVVNGAEVHADGEIWAQTLWDLRTAIGDAGVTERLLVAALKLSPPEPSFIDMRNAILLADTAAGGTYHDLLWSIFAKRGMGYYASANDSNDVAPIADTALPPAAGGTRGSLTGRITDSLLGTPIPNATVSIGGLASVPPQDRLADDTDADGRYSVDNVPVGNYRSIVVRAPGYDQRVFSNVTVAGTLDTTLKRNWVSTSGGGKVRSMAGMDLQDSGCGPSKTLDQNLGTTWSTIFTNGAPKALVVELPEAVDITEIGIDPGEGCGDGDVSALQHYRVEVADSANGAGTVIKEGDFSANDTHRLNLVAASANNVRFVRLVPTRPQVLGVSYIDVSEFAVYGRPHARAPETTILSGPDVVDSTPEPTFTFSSDQPAATFECSLDGAAFAACSSGYKAPPLQDGQHTFRVRAVSAGGVDATPAQRTWILDARYPDTTLTSTPQAMSANNVAAFQFSGNGTSFECKWDNEGYTACTSPASRQLADGAHTFAVRAVNVSGPDPSPASYAFTIDTVAPATAISSATVTGDAATFAFSAPDQNPVTFQCTLDGAAAPCTSPKTYSGLDNGAHTFRVTATDGAGNSASDTRQVNVNVTPYDTELNDTPAELIAEHEARFSFSSPSAGATFECALDGAAFTPCVSPLLVTGIADGTHTFRVRAAGPGARRDPTPEQFTFTVDTTPPETMITFGPPPILTGRDFSLAFGANEPASFECIVDGAVSNCESPLSLSALADGGHLVTVIATDEAGNVDPTPASSAFMVSIPVIPAPSPTPTPTATATATPRVPALTSASTTSSASLRKLRKDNRVKVTVRSARGAKLAVEARIGNRVIGKANVTARTTSTVVTLRLDKKRIRALKSGSSVTVKVAASGSGLVSGSKTLKVKLKL